MFSGYGLEGLSSDVGPREEFIDGAVEMSIDDLGQQVGQIGVGFDAAQLTVFDQRGDDGPVVAAAVGAGEERVLAVESHSPFILPMSGRSWKSITNGIPISAVKLASA